MRDTKIYNVNGKKSDYGCISNTLSVRHPETKSVEKIAEASKPGYGIGGYDESMSVADFVPFMEKMHKVFLNDRKSNTLCSPFAVFLILTVLAISAEGEVRDEIVDMLGVDSIYRLSDIAFIACHKSNRSEEMFKQIARTSVWVKDGLKINYPLLSEFARCFNTDSFCCAMGSDEANNELKNWLSEYTGGTLDELTGDFILPKDSIIDIVSTIYYADTWAEKFDEDEELMMFNGTTSKSRVKSFSGHQVGKLYFGEGFSAIEILLYDGEMMLFLPDSFDIKVEDIMCKPDLFNMVKNGWLYDNTEDANIHIVIPEFEASSNGDIKSKLENLGLSKIFDAGICDFTNLNKGTKPLYVGDVVQASRIKVNKDGVEAAAAVEMTTIVGCALPFAKKKVEFILDRPFGYVLLGAGGVPVMSGIINQV